MNVRNKRSNRWDQGGELPFSFNKSQEIIALERDRLNSQEMKREEYVNRLRRVQGR